MIGARVFEMKRVAGIVVLTCLAAQLVLGQFETAQVLGTVRDRSGSPVPKAAITLLNQETGIQVKTTTDEDGNYGFFNVRVGHYSVTVEENGFSKFSTAAQRPLAEPPAGIELESAGGCRSWRLGD